MEIKITINNQETTIIPVMRGERVREVRESLGLPVGWNPDSHYIGYIGEDLTFEDFEDLEWAQPEWAQALRDANVNTDKVVAVIEIY